MIRAALIAAAIMASSCAAYGQGLMMLGYGPGGNASGVAPSCFATNGQIDFSFCSNAIYVAVIL